MASGLKRGLLLLIPDCWVASKQMWNFGICKKLFDRELPRWAVFTGLFESVQFGRGFDGARWKLDTSGTLC